MRISRHAMFMEMARTVSKRSTCHRLNVGSVLVVNNRVVSIGYNGPPSGEPHCFGNDCPLSENGGCTRSLHAEENALRFMPPGLEDEDKHLYITHSPCPACSLLILGSKITKVFYETPYRNHEPILGLLRQGVSVYRFSPSGYLIDHKDDRIYEPHR